MGLFSGDGAGILARLLARHGAVITGGLHLKMSGSIGDEKALKRTSAQNQALVLQAGQKIERTAQALKSRPRREWDWGTVWPDCLGNDYTFLTRQSNIRPFKN
ncbi:MAG: hypothetical protein HFF18_03515 [Oscillospiraceae bacterium]|nr:hypothetical protein [Oscillospiraceae bacterium]